MSVPNLNPKGISLMLKKYTDDNLLHELRGRGLCVPVWCAEDVEHQAEEMGLEISKGEAYDICMGMDAKHDCTIGINWDVIQSWILMTIQQRDGS